MHSEISSVNCQSFYVDIEVNNNRSPIGSAALWRIQPGDKQLHTKSRNIKCRRPRLRGPKHDLNISGRMGRETKTGGVIL